MKKLFVNDTAPNHSTDVRARATPLLPHCPLNFGGLGGGFAPRHLSRCALRLFDGTILFDSRVGIIMAVLIRKFIIACSAVLLFLACICPVNAQKRKAPKQAVKPATIMSFAEYRKVRHSVPFILRIDASKAHLLYFGAKHTHDPKDVQVLQIENLWKEFHPDIAFFEGADPENKNPVVIKSVEEISQYGEPSLVTFLARRDGVQVHTLEPAKTDEITLLFSRKYTPEQVKLFYVLRQIPQFRNGKHNETMETYTQNVIGGLSLRPELKGAPRNLLEFEESCARLFPQMSDWRETPQEWFDPALLKPLTYLNTVSRELSEFRDRHMVKLITEELKQGKRVFAVVGASHVVMQERALRAALKRRR